MQAIQLLASMIVASSLVIGSIPVFAEGVFPDGTLVMHNQGPGNTTIYYIRNGKKEPIPNWSVFVRQGWKMQQVKDIPQQQVDTIPTGPIFIGNHEVVALAGPGGTTYLIENGQKRPIPDGATFAALGYSWNELVRLPSEQMDSIPTGPAVSPITFTSQEHEDHSCIGVVEFCQKWHFDSKGVRQNDGRPRVCGGCIGLKF